MTSKIRLLSLEMENFQAITNPVKLEFSPITLLYGPNSAGKSSVFDALALARLFWDPTKSDSKELKEKIIKWTHQKGDEKTRQMSISLEIEAPGPRYKDVAYFNSTASRKIYATLNGEEDLIEFVGDKKLRFTFTVATHGNFICNVNRLSIEIEGQPILSLDAVNPDNFISDYYLKIYDHYLVDLYGLNKVSSQDFKGERIASGVEVDGKYFFCEIGFDTIDGDLSILSPETFNINFDDQSLYRQFRLCYTDIIEYFGNILVTVINESFPLVKADRTIPSPSNSIFFHDGVSMKKNDGNSQGGFEIADSPLYSLILEKIKKNDEHFSELAKLAQAKRVFIELKDTIYTYHSELDTVHIPENDENVVRFDRVNRYLSDFLFIEKGYRVDAEPIFLIDLDNAIDPSIDSIVRSPTISKLYLYDTEKRKLELEDVGSGIAFVLPALVRISDCYVSCIQQPELHLHPALQSSLADVIIDRLNDEEAPGLWQSIIETHSEHLLLRLLRRVRETELGKNDDNPIKPEDLSIYYFNPLPQGGIELRKMLVTPLGDFYNTWPRGFFDERNTDLFDE